MLGAYCTNHVVNSMHYYIFEGLLAFQPFKGQANMLKKRDMKI